MTDFPLRRTCLALHEIHHEGGPPAREPRRVAVMAAVVRNPFAGRHEPDLQPAMEALKPLGLMMSERLIAALGGAEAVDGYGKAALVGGAGELEHAALWHVPGGYAMRQLLGAAKAIVPSAMKVGGMGCPVDIPLGHINAAYVRSHFDAVEISLPDAPRPDEILFALAMSAGPRIHHRMGGLAAEDVKGEDGLR